MRKDKQLIAGFGATLVGLVGVMTVWLPNYSPWGKAAHERASRNKASGSQAPQGGLGSASMWKNMNNQARDQ